jgi:hypothetical protein
MESTRMARLELMSTFALLAPILLFPTTAAALDFNGIRLGAKFHADEIRSVLGVDDLRCKQVDYDIIPIECTAEAKIDELGTMVLVGISNEDEIAMVSFTVERSQFPRFEGLCMSRLGTPSSRIRSRYSGIASETWLDNWLFADGSKAALMEYSGSAHGSTLLMLLSKKYRDRTGL